jgi:hypothetical protein
MTLIRGLTLAARLSLICSAFSAHDYRLIDVPHELIRVLVAYRRLDPEISSLEIREH